MKDKFGREEESLNYGKEDFTPVEWDDTTTENVTYLRGAYGEECVIQKIDSVQKKIFWAYGSWEDRVNLQYGTDRLFNRGA